MPSRTPSGTEKAKGIISAQGLQDASGENAGYVSVKNVFAAIGNILSSRSMKAAQATPTSGSFLKATHLNKQA